MRKVAKILKKVSTFFAKYHKGEFTKDLTVLITEFSGIQEATGTSRSRQFRIPKNDQFTMTKGAIQAANQAKKVQIIHVGENFKIVMESDRKRMQKDKVIEKQTMINAGAVKNSNCMVDVDLAFYTSAMHIWGIHGNGINTTQCKQKKNQAKTATKEKRRRSLTPFSYSEHYYRARSKKNTRMAIC